MSYILIDRSRILTSATVAGPSVRMPPMDYTRVDMKLEQFSYLDVLLHRCPIFLVAPEHHHGHDFGQLGHLSNMRT